MSLEIVKQAQQAKYKKKYHTQSIILQGLTQVMSYNIYYVN